MASATKIVECVPNFSEGRDREKIEKIVNPFRTRQGVKLLNYSNDEDHNRLRYSGCSEGITPRSSGCSC